MFKKLYMYYKQHIKTYITKCFAEISGFSKALTAAEVARRYNI